MHYICVCVCGSYFGVPSWGFGIGEVMRHLLTMKRAWKTECSLWLRDGCRLHPKDLAACGLYVPPPYLLGEPIPRVSLQSMSFQFSGDHRYSEGVFAWVWMVYLSGNKACREFPVQPLLQQDRVWDCSSVQEFMCTWGSPHQPHVAFSSVVTLPLEISRDIVNPNRE